MTHKPAPSKADTLALPVFAGLDLPQIVVPASAAQFEAAACEIAAASAVGFDTESKPTFRLGEVSDGPHIVQFALPNKAFIFQLHHAPAHGPLVALLREPALCKVGFGLGSDRSQILAKLGVVPQAVLDLNAVFSRRGYRRDMGVRAAVALMFEQRFLKSKKTTTTNWAMPQLSAAQLRYAANDAYAALRVWQALGEPGHEPEADPDREPPLRPAAPRPA